ncbi:aldehyde dehydrogenase [Guyanagaster necrorhizus]|uniref:Aldehyde dehydrogenase n=1 Tax=Guyanagaster necrorhizus TaxID=856835 RepID=A0A9P7VIW4_9AGAR|nr:aldehyde dehydrogenase [Guyanagaster necrorhizus MCA 3950]KAG7441437.1 aldehyde dehydrogenase [Guyanagaster necrorhizus MCA 3950]
MSQTFSYDFDTPTFKGTTKVHTGLFINGKFVAPAEGGSIEVVNPATGKTITSVAAGTKKDVDLAVKAAKEAYKKSWGLKCPGSERGRLLSKFADLVEQHIDELSALETLNVGKPFLVAKTLDVTSVVAVLRYFAGWADKIQGKVIETNADKLSYTRHEPYGVVGQIIPWNYPMLMAAWKLGPALATGNTVVLKPSEITPLTAQRLSDFIIEAGFPPGVVNIVNGYGNTVGQAISEHPDISKVAFTGSTAVGRKIQEASAKSNLKAVTLELGGKSPCIIFDDADIEQAVKWATLGIFSNAGQICAASSRILLQEGIYDAFVEKFTAVAKSLQHVTGDPFLAETQHGPQVSRTQFERVMSYLHSARTDGAKFHIGGEKHGIGEGFFIQPTVFTGDNHMKAVKEEIFGPVAALIKFKTEEEAIELANDSSYGLAAAVFSENSSRALRVSHQLESGTAYVNCYGITEPGMPFGGYKQSGNGRECGEYALNMYTEVKAVHVNIGMKI